MAKKQIDSAAVSKMKKAGKPRKQHKNKYGLRKAGRKN